MRLVTLRSHLFFAYLLAATASAPGAQGGSVDSTLKWSGAAGTLPMSPTTSEAYSSGLESIGDLDGDGISDVAVGLAGFTGIDGTVWIQFLKADGSVRNIQAITDGVGGFNDNLNIYDRFGRSIASLGDLDGDGVTDIAVSAHGDDDGGNAHGAVYILFMNVDGTVKSHQKISDIEGGFTGVLDTDDFFGQGLASISDLDGDGVTDLVVASPYDDDGGTDRGALYVLFLQTDGTVKSYAKISNTAGTFFGQLDDDDHFGLDALAYLGDMDGDGLPELAVGAPGDDDGGSRRGAVWILELLPNGLVSGFTKISSTSGGFSGSLEDHDIFGVSVDCIDDLNNDGVRDLLVGAYGDDGLDGDALGAIWLLYMNPDGTVRGHEEIAEGRGIPAGVLDDGDTFGVDLTVIDDLDGNGTPEIVVGAYGDDDDAVDSGAAYILFLEPCAVPASATLRNAGTNPQSYTAAPPVMGELWTATVDLSTTGHSLAIIVGFDTPFQIMLGGGQTLLIVDAFNSGEFLGLPFQAGPTATFQLDIPLITAFCGFPLYTQAAHIGGVSPFALSNAMDLVVGI